MQLDFTLEQVIELRKITDNEVRSHHNWIASAIEQNQIERAKSLTGHLRELQEIYKTLNGAVLHAQGVL